MSSRIKEIIEDEVRNYMFDNKSVDFAKGDGKLSVYNEMVEFLDSAWCVRDEIVPCLVGPVGIGKTAAVEEHCRNKGAKRVVKIVASQILPNEVSGITMPDASTKAMEIYDHYRLSSLEDGDILFFDELLEADQLVLSACLTLIESRELMSGRKLPDIQIIAATNPTVKPASLKANIRQRFVFRSFDIDYEGCRRYIQDKYGIDVGNIVNNLRADDADSYNILSQRSLTKMARWITSVPIEDAAEVASQINKIWGSNLGTNMLKILRKKDPEIAFRNSARAICMDIAHENKVTLEQFMCNGDGENVLFKDGISQTTEDIFRESSISDLYEILSNLPDWEKICAELEKIPCPEPDDSNVVDF